MVNEQFKYLLPETKKKWTFLRVLGWAVYTIFAIIGIFCALIGAGPWFGLAVTCAFIFGPKLFWKL
jgi:hypothetical protein